RSASDPPVRPARRRACRAAPASSARISVRSFGQYSRTVRRYPPTSTQLVLIGAGAWVAGFAALSVLRQKAFFTGRFDMGNMVQAVWSTAHGHPLRMTGLQGEQISR